MYILYIYYFLILYILSLVDNEYISYWNLKCNYLHMIDNFHLYHK